MFWSDVSHKTISSAQLNGTGLRVLVNTGIDVPGDLIVFCTLSQAVIQYQCIDLTFGAVVVQQNRIVSAQYSK